MTPLPLLCSFLLLAQPPAERSRELIPLWSGKAPHTVVDSASDKPSLTVYPAAKPNGAAIVVCPGGGYGFLADDHEGKQVAEYFNALGVHAFVLKYRIVQKDRPGPLHPAPLEDAQRAIRTVRDMAKKLGIDMHRVGIIGFSAGGHLASSAGTHFDEGNKDAEDAIDKQSCRPDFLVLGYPVISFEDDATHKGSRTNLIGAKPDAKLIEYYSSDKQVTAKTPPTFIFHTSADTAVLPENAVRFYLALKKAKVPVELHVYEKGRHGVGLGRDPKWTGGETSVATWPDRLSEWLTHRELLKTK